MIADSKNLIMKALLSEHQQQFVFVQQIIEESTFEDLHWLQCSVQEGITFMLLGSAQP